PRERPSLPTRRSSELLTALENLMIVPAGQSGENLLSAWLRPRLVARESAEVRAKARDVIGFLGLADVRNELAGNLSGGQKKLLEDRKSTRLNSSHVKS